MGIMLWVLLGGAVIGLLVEALPMLAAYMARFDVEFLRNRDKEAHDDRL